MLPNYILLLNSFFYLNIILYEYTAEKQIEKDLEGAHKMVLEAFSAMVPKELVGPTLWWPSLVVDNSYRSFIEVAEPRINL